LPALRRDITSPQTHVYLLGLAARQTLPPIMHQ
jgi:hypothetical protein